MKSARLLQFIFIGSALAITCRGISAQEKTKPETLVYDGFNTGTGARCYLHHLPLAASGAPTSGTVGFAKGHGWKGATNHVRPRDATVRDLKHHLLKSTQPGSLGHWMFNGVQRLRRRLASAPKAKTGVYTLCVLVHAHDNRRTNLPLTRMHTTNFPKAHALIGFTPGNANGKSASERGLGLGYYEDDLRVFAGGKSFSIVKGYNEGATYLLCAEMTASKTGAEYIRGFFARAKGGLMPAPFNSKNGGKGVKIETWSTPKDLLALEIFLSDTDKLSFSPQASPSDLMQKDFITWDEVRLLDGRVGTPILPHRAEKSIAAIAAKKGLISYWTFDEVGRTLAKDVVAANHLQLQQASISPHHKFGRGSLDLNDRSPNGSGMAALSFDKAEQGGLVFDAHQKLTFSAWVRGRVDGSWGGLNDIISMARSGQSDDNRLRDKRGLSFSISSYRLRFSLIHSINIPKKDNRLTVTSLGKVPDNAQFHHVAVTYDGSRKSKGVTFYINGVKNNEFANDFADQGCQLTGSSAVAAPFNIGGRNNDHKDRFRFGFSGYIDDVGVYRDYLTAGEVIAIHSLAAQPKLKYNLQQVNRLIQLQRAKKGTVVIGRRTWRYLPAIGTKTNVGQVQQVDGNFRLPMNADGSGVQSKKK